MPTKYCLIVWILFACICSLDIFSCTFEIFPGAKKVRRHSTAVFVGKVLNVWSLSNGYAITFAVVKSWEGIKDGEISPESLSAAHGDVRCPPHVLSPRSRPLVPL